MRKVKVYRCPICNKPYKTLTGWVGHMNLEHPEHRPTGFSDTRYFYFCLTGKTEGKCVTCGKPTEWNESTQKYNRFCNNPQCKVKYKEVFNQRMIKKYGKVSLCDDPEQQRKMLKARHISGQYQFKDGGKVDYVGSYEKDFLKMMDMFLRFKSSDIMAPSPHTYSYQYEGETHFYIPDFFIPDLNLEVEIKDETTTHPKFLAVDKVKEKLKDEVLASIKAINYIKVTDKKYDKFFDLLNSLKDGIEDKDVVADQKTKNDLAMESTRRFYKDHPTYQSAMEAMYGKNWVTEAYSGQAYLPSILDKITATGKNDIPYDVEAHLKLATADPNANRTQSQKEKDRDTILTMIHEFGTLSDTKAKRKKAKEIYDFVMNYNVNINLRSYPDIVAHIEAPPITVNELVLGKKKLTFNGLALESSEKFPNWMKEYPVHESSITGKGLKPVYVICMHTGTPLATIIQKFTKDEFSHAAISFNPDFSPFYSFGNRQKEGTGGAGFTIDNIKDRFYQERNIHWAAYVVFVDNDSYNLMKEKIQYFVRREYVFRYNLTGLLNIAVNLPSENSTKFFCSGFVADILQVGGKNNDRSYTLYKPQDLADLYAAYEVGRGESFRELDKMSIIRNTDKMKRKYIQEQKKNM